MNTPLAVRPHTAIHALEMDERELIRAMESLLYPGAKEESIKLVIANCRAQLLDPMTKPFHIVPMQVKRRKQNGNGFEYIWRDVVMPAIELYRIKAARTGEYAGMDEATWGPDIELELGGEDKTEWDEDARARVKKGNWDKVKIIVPDWCECTVYRLVKGTRYPFRSGRVYWQETYATAGRDTSLPNEMWRKRKRGQLEKCAEAMALRRAFPEIGAAPIREEIEGKVIDIDSAIEGSVSDKTIEPAGPQAKEFPAPAGSAGAPGNGGEASGAAGDPLSEGAKATLRKQMEKAGRTEMDLKAAGFPPLDEMSFRQHFNDAMKWLKENQAQK